MTTVTVVAARPRTGEIPSWRRWTLACAAGETLGMAAAAGTAWLLAAGLGEPTDLVTGLLLWAGTTAGGALEGVAVALLTWVVLHPWLPALSRTRWLRATVGVTLCGWALGTLPSTVVAGAMGGVEARADSGFEPPWWLVLLGALVAGAVLGALFGAVQARVLRGVVAHPARWVQANALGWAVALTVIMVGATSAPAGLPLAALLGWGAVTGSLAGLAIGGITGAFLPALVDP